METESQFSVCIFSLLKCTNLDGLVGVGDESDEEAQHHVDEERDEGVEIEPAEKPDHVALVSHLEEGSIHVVPIDQWEQTLAHLCKWPELEKQNDFMCICVINR